MENIENKVCNIAIDRSYKSFEEAMILANCKSNGNTIQDKDVNSIYDSVLIITDQNVYKHQLNKFIDKLKVKTIYEYIIPVGEDSKSLEVYEEIINYCIRINLSRKSVIIALGGGVVGDLAGYVASTYMRGVDVVQVPTTLLAQVDSSIGGKTGISIGNFKNIVGTFYQPKLVYINVGALESLAIEEFETGMSEVIKYSLIYDYEFLDYLIENSEDIMERKTESLYYIVKKCASIKADVVGEDEKEGGLRKILNFGHTFGHGVEKLCKISHGHAVSIGMNMAFKLSLQQNIIEQGYYDKFITVCEKYNLPIEFEDADEKEVLEIMKSDKKNSFGKIHLVLPVGQGKVEVVNNIDEEIILDIVKRCKYA